MIIRREVTAEHELIKWLVILALASALVVVYAAKSASDDILKSTRSLPGGSQQWVIPEDLRQDLLAMGKVDSIEWGDAAERYALTVKLKQIVNHHRTENHEQALLAWQEVRLPLEAEVWRAVAIAASYMRSGDDWAAKPYLKDADVVANDNGVISFLKAEILWREMQKESERGLMAGYTSIGFDRDQAKVRLAIEIYNKVLVQAAHVDTLAPIVPRHWGVRDNSLAEATIYPPTVGELLQVLHLSDYVAIAHGRLGVLYERAGELDNSETQLDKAAEWGLDVSSQYLSLARTLKLTGKNAAAQRVFKKALEVRKGRSIYTTPRWLTEEKPSLHA